jgi:hypothetical protein
VLEWDLEGVARQRLGLGQFGLRGGAEAIGDPGRSPQCL